MILLMTSFAFAKWNWLKTKINNPCNISTNETTKFYNSHDHASQVSFPILHKFKQCINCTKLRKCLLVTIFLSLILHNKHWNQTQFSKPQFSSLLFIRYGFSLGQLLHLKLIVKAYGKGTYPRTKRSHKAKF